MKAAFSIARLGGTTVRAHVTLTLLLAWFGFGTIARGSFAALPSTAGFLLAVLASVMLHEFGHVLAARRFGIHAIAVTLLPFGGITTFAKPAENLIAEAIIASAGPAANAFLAAVLFATARYLTGEPAGALRSLAEVNLSLAVFNLLPALPLDGGRIARVGLSAAIGRPAANRILVGIGVILGTGLGIIGLIRLDPLMIFIAIFVFQSALQGVRQKPIATKTGLARKSSARDPAEEEWSPWGPAADTGDTRK